MYINGHYSEGFTYINSLNLCNSAMSQPLLLIYFTYNTMEGQKKVNLPKVSHYWMAKLEFESEQFLESTFLPVRVHCLLGALWIDYGNWN